MTRSRAALLALALVAAFVGVAATRTSYPSIVATACTNQFVRSIAAATGTATCATVNFATDGTGAVPVANAGSGDTGTAWVDYTPTVTCGTSGTITADTIAAKYKQLLPYKTIVVNVNVNISTLGTCLGSLIVTTPLSTSAVAATIGSGFNATTSAGVPVFVSGTNINVVFAASPAANNYFATITYGY